MSTGQTINMNLNLQTNIGQANQQAQQLNQNLTQAQRTASSIRMPSGGARPASQTAAVASAAAPTGGALGGLGRGATGVGGEVDSKNFARQAQGLGGLVHVYATFAANLFAVSAAFNALSKAADVTNMVEGLNQLGAASGKNLGSMAKNLTMISDGAISLKEAMQATAQASAAGLSGEQLERMTKVAKTASQALGRDMGDALNRLSRGVTKIEPELLDELGIMVKVDKAARDYALTLGKTASQLTDFEKRQSFANAVIEQGERKFGAINIDANPFQKLLATFTNLTVAGGELVNKVLGPIAKYLGESPAALGIAMAGIAGTLLSKAIPALSQWKQGVVEAAEVAEAKAKRISEALRDFKINKSLEPVQAQAQKADDARNQAYQLAQTNKLFGERSKTMYELAGGSQSLATATQQTDTKIKSLTASLEQERKALIGVNEVDKLEKGAAKIELLEQQKRKYVELAAAIELANQEKAKELALENAAVNAESTMEEKIRQRISDKSQRNAGAKRVSAQVVNNTETMGAAYAWKQISKDIEEHNTRVDSAGAKIGKLQSGMLHFTGGLKIVGATIGAVANAFGNLLGYFALAGVAFSLLDGLLSTNAKQAEEFSNSFNTVKESGEGVVRTIELLEKKSGAEFLSPESLQARANALNEVATSTSNLITKFEKLQEASSGWDKLIDGFKSMWGGDSKSKLGEGLASGIVSSLRAMSSGPAKEKAQAAIASLLGTDKLNTKGLEEAFSKLDTNTLKEKGKEVTAILDQMNKDVNNSASKLTSMNESFKATVKEYDTIVASFNPADSMTKLAVGIMTTSNSITTAINGTTEGMSALSDIVNDVSKLKLFSPEISSALLAAKPQINEAAAALGNMQKELEVSEEQQIKATQAVDEAAKKLREGTGIYILNKRALEEATAAQAAWNETLERKRELLREAEARAEEVVIKLKPLFDQSFENGIKQLSLSLGAAAEKAALTIGKASIAGLSGPGVANAEAELAKQEISIQQRMIDSQAQLVISQEKLRLAVEKQSILDQQKLVNEDKKLTDGEKTTKLTKLSASFKTNEDSTNALNSLDNVSAKKAFDTLSSSSLEVRKNLQGVLVAYAGIIGKQTELAAQLKSVESQRLLKSIEEGYQVKVQELNIAKQTTSEELARVNTAMSLTSTYSEALQSRKEELLLTQQSQIEADHAAKIGEIQASVAERIKVAQTNTQRTAISLTAGYKIQEAVMQRTAALEKNRAELEAAKIDRIKRELEISKQILETAFKQREIERQIAEESRNQQGARIDRAKNAGLYDESQAAQAQGALALQNQQASFAGQADSLTFGRDQKLAELNSKKSMPGADSAAIQKEIDLVNQRYQMELSGLTAVNALKIQGIEAQNKVNEQQAAYNDLLAVQQSLVDSLTGLFGDLGQSVGTLVAVQTEWLAKSTSLELSHAEESKQIEADRIKAIVDLAADQNISDEEYFDKKKQLDSNFAKKSEESNANYNKKKQKQDEDYALKSVASAKNMFGKKTAAYKVFDAVEKAMHVQRLARDVIEMASKVANWLGLIPVKAATEATLTAEEAAGAASRSSITVAEIWGKAVSTLGPIAGPIAGAALTAAFLSMLGMGGGGGPSGGFVPSAAQKQEVQGTGQSWNSKGEKVDNGWGKLGDSSAKSESISKGIEHLSRNSFPLLEVNRGMLRHLQLISASMRNLTSLVFRNPGITNPTGANSPWKGVEGTKRSNPLVGAGLTGGVTGVGLASAFGTALGPAGLGLAGITMLASKLPVIGGIVNKIASALFGSKSSTKITDSGFNLKGSVAGGNYSGIAQQYMDSETRTKKKAFGFTYSDKTRQNPRQFESLGDDFNTQAGLIINGFVDTVESGLKTLGFSASELSASMGLLEGYSLDLSVSLKDLKADEAAKAIEGVFSDAFDKIVARSIPWITEFRTANESLGETFTRLVAQYSDVNNALLMSGLPQLTRELLGLKGAADTSIQAVLHIQQALVDGAGGLENFVTQAGFFSENFLTAAQRLAPVQTALNTRMSELTPELAALGKTVPHTRAEFTSLVQGLDLTTEAGRTMYQNLMDVAPAFDAVASASEELAQSAQDAYNSLYDKFIEPLLTTPQKIAKANKTVTKAFDPTKEGSLGSLLKAAGVSTEVPRTRAQIGALVTQLEGLGESGQAALVALEGVAPALDEITSAAEDVASGVASIVSRAQEMSFQFEYDTKDNAGKYKMNDDKADKLYDSLQTALTASPAENAANWAQNASSMNKLLDVINTNWNLLDAEQKAAHLQEYQDKLKDVQSIAERLGLSAIEGMTPDGINTVDAIKTSSQLIVDAIKATDPTGVLETGATAAEKTLTAVTEQSTALSMLEELKGSGTFWIEQRLFFQSIEGALNSLVDTDPTTNPQMEKLYLLLEQNKPVSTDTQEDAQKKSVEAIEGLKNGTKDMTDVIKAFQGMIEAFTTKVNTPVDVNLNLQLKNDGSVAYSDVNGTGRGRG